MKILLTGPTGFIGKAFIRQALALGHEVAGLIIPSEDIPAEFRPRPQAAASSSSIQWLRGTLDEAPWKEIAAFGPEVCLHMAWITTPGIYLESQENVRFRDASLNFIRALLGKEKPYIFALGTCIEYQPSDQPLSEDRSRIAPATLYSRCKNDLRIALESEAEMQHFGFCWGRVFYPYGPGEHPSRLCTSIIQKLARNEKVLLKTPASTKDYIYITDLAAALLTVLEKKFLGPINLGTGIGVSVREIAQTISKTMGRSELVEEAAQPEADPLPHVVADATRLKSLGWLPQWTMTKGLHQMVNQPGPAI